MIKRLLTLVLIGGATLLSAASKLSPDLPKSQGNQLYEVIVQFNSKYKTQSNNGWNGNGNDDGNGQNHHGNSYGNGSQNGNGNGQNGNGNGQNGNNGNQNGNWQDPDYNNNLQQLGQKGEVKTQLPRINAVHMKLTLSQIQALQADPTVAYVTPNRPSARMLDITAQTVAANLGWQLGYTGTGVGVAVIDSGIAFKDDLTGPDGRTSRVVYSQNFVAGQDTTDGYGHGTHVAGIIGSNGDDSTGNAFARTFKGIAPNVNLISLKVLDQNGMGQEADVIAAIQAAIDLKNTYNIRVINLSLGRPVFESYTLDPLCQAVEAAWNAGIVVVTAAGNYGRDNSRLTHGFGTISSPGNDPYVITVGATNTKGTPSPYDDQIASYSAKGPTAVDHIVKPDIVAPGNGVVSVLASTTCTLYTQSAKTHVSMSYETGVWTPGVSTSYLKLSGTSMATPVVAGAAALLIQKNPSLTPDQVKARLMKSAKKILPRYMTSYDAVTFTSFWNHADIFTVGAGYLDVNAALASNDLITVSAMSPVAILDPVTHHVTMSSKVYGWDDFVVWGDSMFTRLPDGTLIVWGADDFVVWGDSTSAGFGVIWGDTVNFTIPIQATGNEDSDQ